MIKILHSEGSAMEMNPNVSNVMEDHFHMMPKSIQCHKVKCTITYLTPAQMYKIPSFKFALTHICVGRQLVMLTFYGQ